MVERQLCSACGSESMHNLIATDRTPTVYVRCGDCGRLVARYRVAELYLHGRGLESYLRSLGVRSGESGRDFLAEFGQLEAEAIKEFQQVLEDLEAPPERPTD